MYKVCCTHVSVCVCIYTHAFTCRGQSRMPGAFSCNSVSYYLMTGSLAGLKLTILNPPVPCPSVTGGHSHTWLFVFM